MLALRLMLRLRLRRRVVESRRACRVSYIVLSRVCIHVCIHFWVVHSPPPQLFFPSSGFKFVEDCASLYLTSHNHTCLSGLICNLPIFLHMHGSPRRHTGGADVPLKACFCDRRAVKLVRNFSRTSRRSWARPGVRSFLQSRWCKLLRLLPNPGDCGVPFLVALFCRITLHLMSSIVRAPVYL